MPDSEPRSSWSRILLTVIFIGGLIAAWQVAGNLFGQKQARALKPAEVESKLKAALQKDREEYDRMMQRHRQSTEANE